MKISEVYEAMIDAANRATAQKDRAIHLEREIEERERKRDKNVSRVILDSAITANPLVGKAYDTYKFWMGEQLRLGNLIQSHCNYIMAISKNLER